jgi:type IV pilus assembly protein PilC
MLFSKRLPLGALIELCRALRHQMEAGLTLAQAMKNQGKKGPLAVRPVAARMAVRLAKGEDFQTILPDEQAHFPPLFLALSAVAEETGKLPEVLRDLEEFFELQRTLWKQFLSRIAWPVFQFVAATLVLALVMWLLGVIEGIRGPSNVSVIGLKGGRAAGFFLFAVYGSIAGAFLAYYVLRNVLGRGPMIDGLLLMLPTVGHCLRHFALARFSMGMSLTMEAGVPIPRAVRLALNATGNTAYAAAGDKLAAYLAQGGTLADGLRETGLFPEEFEGAVDAAEVAGTEPEIFHRLAGQHNEEAGRWLRRLAGAAAGLTWLLVAIFIIAFIINLVSQYLGALDDALKMNGL